MRWGELWEAAMACLNIHEVPKGTGATLFKSMMRDLQRRTYLGSLIVTQVVSVPEHGWGFEAPSDYYDDEGVLIISKMTSRLTVPLTPCRTADEYLAWLGNAYLEYLNESISPTLPNIYYVGKPSVIFRDASTVFPTPDNTYVLFYPRCDNTQYEAVFTYMKQIVPDEIADDYTNEIMQKYPEWVLYEFVWRLAVANREPEKVDTYRELALEKYYEVKANESKEVLTPHPTLHLKGAIERMHVVTKRPPV